MSGTRRLYVIGDKQTGVAFVTLDPLRAALVSKDEIESFAKKQGKTSEEVFGAIAKAIQAYILRFDTKNVPASVQPVPEAIGALIATGSTISDAEFCFVSDLIHEPKVTMRNPWDPLEPILNHIGDGTPGFESKAFPAPLKP